MTKLVKVEFNGYKTVNARNQEEWVRDFSGSPDGLRWRRPESGVHPTKTVRFYPLEDPAVSADVNAKIKATVDAYRELADYGFTVTEVDDHEARAWYVEHPHPLPELLLLPRGTPPTVTHRPVIPDRLQTAEDRRNANAAFRQAARLAKQDEAAAKQEAPTPPKPRGRKTAPTV